MSSTKAKQIPKTPKEIETMRISGRILADILDLLEGKVEAGMTGKDISAIVKSELKALGAEPAFMGYNGFPDVICISISEQVQHGIPSKRKIKDGDVVNLDFGVNYKGLITDSGRTLAIGKISKDAQRLLRGTEEALYAAIDELRAGVSIRHISGVIEDVLNRHKLGIVMELVGHGVGHSLHEDPEIPNYRSAASNAKLIAGQTIAIEPITTLGSGRINFEADGWTITSADKTLSAQFEHTLLITAQGSEVLTASKL